MGGMQKHTTNLVKNLAKNNVRVSLFTSFPGGFNREKLKEVFTTAELENIVVYSVPFPKVPSYPGHYIRQSYLHSKAIYEAMVKQGFGDIDFIYAQGFAGWYTLGRKRKQKNLPPVGVNFHGLEMYQPAFGRKNKLSQRLFRPFVKKNIENADVYFSLGHRLSDIVKKIVPGKKIVEIPVAVDRNWVDENLEKLPGPEITFVFIGRYERRKGVEELMAALNALDRPLPFHFIGDLPVSVTSQLHNRSKAVFHGVITNEKKIMDILRQCDVLVCPSYSEGMPTVILEAMARSLAVLATDVGAINELVDQRNGWIISPGNIHELSQSLMEAAAIGRRELSSKQAFSHKKLARGFTWDAVIQRTITEIKQLVS